MLYAYIRVATKEQAETYVEQKQLLAAYCKVLNLNFPSWNDGLSCIKELKKAEISFSKQEANSKC
ncbi:hypothetical protein [Paenibacillus elgii]|uniref:hypothetical protein n=1 Tax=Paenibacillus elgii TaxID=189691 RepID=UPI00203F3A78|nr:hypothetical protein [Paenibacillus elgii]MCM3273692.1 hypothetical protein [Paenibacillus elgii]